MHELHTADTRTFVFALTLLALGCAPIWAQQPDAVSDPSTPVLKAAMEMEIDRYLQISTRTRVWSGKKVNVVETRFREKNGYKFDDLLRFCQRIESKNPSVKVTRFNFGKRDQNPGSWWRPVAMTVIGTGDAPSALRALDVFQKAVNQCLGAKLSVKIDRLKVESTGVTWSMSVERKDLVKVLEMLNQSTADSPLIKHYHSGTVRNHGDRCTVENSKLRLEHPATPKPARPNAVRDALEQQKVKVVSYKVEGGVAIAELRAKDADTLMTAIEAARAAAGAQAVTLSSWSTTAGGGRACTVEIAQ